MVFIQGTAPSYKVPLLLTICPHTFLAMTETERINNLLHRTYHGEAWHGPPIVKVLQDVTASQAATSPLTNAHSIWEIVLHLITWQDAVARHLQGEAYRPSPEANFPPLPSPSDEEAWQTTRQALEASALNLQRQLQSFADENLDTLGANGYVSNYVELHGMIHHNLYHLGQIVLLKKLL